MKKTTLLLVFAIFIGTSHAEAQFLKKAWNSVKKEVNEGVDKLGKKVKNNSSSNSKKESDSGMAIEDVDFEKGIVFKSPSKDFINFELQKHGNLPRLGAINSYGAYTTTKYSYNDEMSAKMDAYNNAQSLYFLMTKMKYLSKYYKYLNHSVLYPKSSISESQEERAKKDFQNKLQGFLETIAYRLASESGKEKYFVNPNAGYGGNALTWGGRDSDEFRKMEVYQKFVEHNLENLMAWGQDFFLNDEFEFYLVQSLKLNNYNFEKQAYEVRLPRNGLKEIGVSSKYNGDIRNPFGEYVPQNEFEYNLNENAFLGHHFTLLKLSPSEAKEIKESLSDYSGYKAGSQKVVFMVRKVKVEAIAQRRTLKPKDDSLDYQEQEFSFSFSEPFAEFYSDEGLKNKIGTVQIFSTEANQNTGNGGTSQKAASAPNSDFDAPTMDVQVTNYSNKYRELESTAVPFRSASVSPFYEGCPNLSPHRNEACFKNKLQEYFRANTYALPYADLPKRGESAIRGSMIIDENGKIAGLVVTRVSLPNLPFTAPQEERAAYKSMAVDVLSKMPPCTPGMQDGKTVKVKYDFQLLFNPK